MQKKKDLNTPTSGNDTSVNEYLEIGNHSTNGDSMSNHSNQSNTQQINNANNNNNNTPITMKKSPNAKFKAALKEFVDDDFTDNASTVSTSEIRDDISTTSDGF